MKEAVSRPVPGNPISSSEPDGLLLVGHGTRDSKGTAQFFQLADVLASRLAPLPVEGCLLEFQHPTIPEAWQTLVSRGCKQIRVAPLLLFAAGHARQDIPEAVAECAAATPEIQYSQSGPLSRSPTLVDLLSRRVEQSLRRSARIDTTDSVALVAVGRGSYDPCARADMLVLGEILARRTGLTQHAVGFYAMAEPRLPEVLDQAAQEPGIDVVIVQPHLLFQGRLYDAIERQVAEAGERHPRVRFIVGDYLGPVPEVADALAHRALVPALA